MQVIQEKVQPVEMPVLSASTINLFIEDPALWVLKYFYGLTGTFGKYACRGVAVEDGLNAWVEGLMYYQDIALDNFIEYTFPLEDDVSDIVPLIKPWTEHCVNIFEGIKDPVVSLQTQIHHVMLGIDFTGFIDFEYEDCTRDLKTVNKLPKVLARGPRKGMLEAGKKGHIRQQAIYTRATGKPSYLEYITPTGEHLSYLVTEEEVDEAMIDVESTVEDIKKLLTLPLEDVIKDTVPNFKKFYSMYWDDKLRMAAQEIWADHIEEVE